MALVINRTKIKISKNKCVTSNNAYNKIQKIKIKIKDSINIDSSNTWIRDETW